MLIGAKLIAGTVKGMHSVGMNDVAKIQKAATLLLVRDVTGTEPDAQAGKALQVYMVERPARGAFPGLHVFTGGKVDAADEALLETMDWQGPTESEAGALLNLDPASVPLSYWLAAVRECYEESGVMLGTQRGAALNADTVAELANTRLEEFGGLAQRLGITLCLDQLRYFAHWITPEIAPRRFDTRFFIARMPLGQTATHAPGETVSGEWIAPVDALQRAEDGRWNLIMPTLTSLRSLLPYSSVDELFAAVACFEHLPEHTAYLLSEGMQPVIDPAAR